MKDMSPLHDYFILLRDAFNTSEATDMFDLRSEDNVSVDKWNRLLAEECQAQLALINHIKEHSEAICNDLRGAIDALQKP